MENNGVYKMSNYPLTLETCDGQVIARCPDLPELFAVGDDEGDAITEACDALEECIAGRIKDREEVPRPSPAKGRPVATVDSLIAAKVLLHNELLAQEVRHVKLSAELNVDPKDIRRLVDVRHRSHIGQIDRALRKLGKRLDIRIVKTA